MKKLVILLFMLSFLVSGCSSSKPVSGNLYDFQHDDQYYLAKVSGPKSAITESDNGYYFFSGPEELYLYYMDKSTMKPMIMCNKPDCLHTDETIPTKITNCNAFFNDSGYYLAYYDSSLYIVGSTGSSPLDTSLSLYKVSPDATVRKRLFSFKDDIYNIIIHRGYVYYVVNEVTSSANEDFSKAKSKVCRVDLSDTGKPPELLFEYEGYHPVISGLVGYRDSVYFKLSYYEDAELKIHKNILYRYNIISDKCDRFIDDASKWIFYDGTIVFCDSNQQIYTCKLDGSDIRKMDNVKGAPHGTDGKYIYLYLQNDQNKQANLLVYDWNGKAVESFDISHKVLYGGDDRYFFIYERDGSSFENGPAYRIYAIDKNKLADGTATMEKVFEFIPKVKFPGVITN